MALQKTIQHESGATSNYWKVGKIKVVMEGYVSQEARESGKENLDDIILDLEDTVIKEAIYNVIKNKGEFEGSLDV